MSNTVFPTLPGLGIAIKRSPPIYAVGVQTTDSQKELRVRRGTSPRYRFRIDFSGLRTSASGINEVQQVLDMFINHVGVFDSFLFNDPYDGSQKRVRFESADDFERIASGLWKNSEIAFITVL